MDYTNDDSLQAAPTPVVAQRNAFSDLGGDDTD